MFALISTGKIVHFVRVLWSPDSRAHKYNGKLKPVTVCGLSAVKPRESWHVVAVGFRLCKRCAVLMRDDELARR